MLTSELTVHMLKCIVRGHVYCPLIHYSSFVQVQALFNVKHYCQLSICLILVCEVLLALCNYVYQFIFSL